MRFDAASKYSLLISMPMKFLFKFLQATPVEPTPINGSSTTSFSLDAILIMCSKTEIGF